MLSVNNLSKFFSSHPVYAKIDMICVLKIIFVTGIKIRSALLNLCRDEGLLALRMEASQAC